MARYERGGAGRPGGVKKSTGRRGSGAGPIFRARPRYKRFVGDNRRKNRKAAGLAGLKPDQAGLGRMG